MYLMPDPPLPELDRTSIISFFTSRLHIEPTIGDLHIHLKYTHQVSHLEIKHIKHKWLVLVPEPCLDAGVALHRMPWLLVLTISVTSRLYKRTPVVARSKNMPLRPPTMKRHTSTMQHSTRSPVRRLRDRVPVKVRLDLEAGGWSDSLQEPVYNNPTMLTHLSFVGSRTTYDFEAAKCALESIQEFLDTAKDCKELLPVLDQLVTLSWQHPGAWKPYFKVTTMLDDAAE
jgi:hypothetical protein